MFETPEDLASLQELLDRSYAKAGAHLLDVHTPPRRISAVNLVARLQGMCLLVLATVTSDGRPLTGPVDGIFYRGAFSFSSSPESVRLRHIAHRPQVSATHLPSEEFAAVVHGRAEPVDLTDPAHAGFRQCLLGVYGPRYGPEWEAWLAQEGGRYYRIDARRMFGFLMDEPDKDEPNKDEPNKDEPNKDEPDKDEPDKDEPDKDEPDKDEPDKDGTDKDGTDKDGPD